MRPFCRSRCTMPELPEVETVRRGLTPVMEGQVIAQADVNRPDLRWPFPPQMAAAADRPDGSAVCAGGRNTSLPICPRAKRC